MRLFIRVCELTNVRNHPMSSSPLNHSFLSAARQQFSSRRRARFPQKVAGFRRLVFERFEERVVLHANAMDFGDIIEDHAQDGSASNDRFEEVGRSSQIHVQKQSAMESINGSLFELTWDPARAPISSAVQFAPATFPLSSIPVLNSLVGAYASLYLDFDGNFDSTWGSYSNITTPVFDQDGDPTTFSDSELTSMRDIWTAVTEDFAPFKINVTTVEPTSFANGISMRVAIGGDGAWTGGTYGGISYVSSFTSLIVNTSYVFPKNLSNGNARYTADASSHEAGHSFGLLHQSQYDTSGTKTSEYYAGPGDGRAPIMGVSYYAIRGLWWNGTSSSGPSNYQDDMAILAGATNGFGFRSDDRGDTAATATALNSTGNAWSGTGIVGTNTDLDMFSFTIATEDTYRIVANVDSLAPNLNAVLELRNSAGQLLVTANPQDMLSAKIVRNLTPGNYSLAIKSSETYGGIGQYSINIDALAEGITVTPASIPMTTSEDGRQTSFTVALQTQPTADVTIPISSSNPAEGTVSAASLVFTSGNWNIPQTVTITGVDDAIVDSDIAYSIIIGAASSVDAAYNGFDAADDVAVVNVDNDETGYVYRTNFGTGTIERARLGGSQSETLVDLKTVLGPAFRSKDFAVDNVGSKIYWTASDASTVMVIQRANLDGSNVETLVSSPYTYGGYRGITLDVAAGKMYWIDNTAYNNKIRSANLDGTNIQDVVTGSGGVQWAMSLALDTTAGKVYWTDFGAGAANAIRRANLDGTNVEIVWTSVDARSPTGLALDVGAGKMYWTDSTQDLIRRADLNGANVEVLENTATLGTGSASGGIALDIPAGKMYWTDNTTKTIYRANLDGSTTVSLVSLGMGAGLEGLAIVFPGPQIPGIIVSRRAGLVTSEDGASDVFRIALNTQPSANITIPISSSDLTEGNVSISSVTFTPSNWNFAQDVTVTGVNDSYSDSSVAYTIALGMVVSADAAYEGMIPGNVLVTNLDNDIVTSTFTKTQNSSIPDPGTLTSSLTVTNVGTILDVNVQVNINHTWDEDLDVFLIAPDGTRVELFTDVGGSNDNFTNTVLDDEATTSMTVGVAPFTGSFKPEGNLSILDGKNLSGIWKLEVTDDTRINQGTLLNWSILARYTTGPAGPKALVTPTSGLVTTEGGGTASFTVRLDNPPIANVTIPLSTSDTTEGTVTTPSLIFTPANWNVAQTVTITGVDDSIVDGNIAYTIVLGAATSADPDFNGLNPADVSVTNNDNEFPPTKFYVVNDGSPDRTYEYGASGTAVENYTLNSGNSAPRGAASTAAGNTVWVIDTNRNVYVYNTGGGLLGSWIAGTMASNATPEGIATNGTDVWIVDSRSAKVYKYAGAATRLSGSQTAASSFNLNGSNTSPKDIVTDGTYLWVVNDSSTDKVFKYSVAGSLQGSWTITTSGASSPTGITIDPANVSNIWIVDNASKLVYQYTASATLTTGNLAASSTFALAAGNTNPQGIADPPPPSAMLFNPTSTAIDNKDIVSKAVALAGVCSPMPWIGTPVSDVASVTLQPVRSKASATDELMSVLGLSPERIMPSVSVGRMTTIVADKSINLREYIEAEIKGNNIEDLIGLVANNFWN